MYNVDRVSLNKGKQILNTPHRPLMNPDKSVFYPCKTIFA